MIPYGRQTIDEDDIESVVKVLKSDFLTQGPLNDSLNREICKKIKAQFSVATNSCTSALHIACLALGLKKGDILWTSANSFVASANCALYCGADVDFLDIDPNTGLIDISLMEKKLKAAKIKNSLPKIVIPVHFAGQSCDMESIYFLSKKFGFRIIEDAAHALGAKYNDQPVGSCKYSDLTVFSFHAVKVITSGEGGAVVTNSKKLYNKLNLLVTHGITRNEKLFENKTNEGWYYEQKLLGFNYRLTDIQAALALSQLKKLDVYITKRHSVADWYKKELNLPSFIKHLEQKRFGYSSFHLYVLRIDPKFRDSLFRFLRSKDIGVNLHYIPIYHQPFHRKNIFLKGAEEHYKSAISIPIFPSITDDELRKVRDSILNFFEDL